tara:strand:- start:1149 stop:2531 length:1383 start_codon:yes stop_codon:yes gene_type:complete
MFKSEQLLEKWSPLIKHEELPEITDSHRKNVTAVLLENQEKFLKEEKLLTEAAPTNSTGTGVQNFDPVLISLIRRSMPNLIAYDIASVQPMSGPTGLIFAMRSRYAAQDGNEALFNEPNAGYSGGGASGYDVTAGYTGGATGANASANNDAEGDNPGILNDTSTYSNHRYEVTGDAQGMTTSAAETLGDGGGTNFREMAFSIEKVAVTARSRALKAEYSLELAQDLRAIHGLDAEAELANILSTEILAEINREVIRSIYVTARPGAQNNTATAGIFDLDLDSNGRWSVEKFKGLLFQVEREANAIAQETRRGKGNIIVCSADVASALTMAGVLDYTPALNANLNVDDTGSTYAGTINGKFKVYIDPYSANLMDDHYFVVGYKGSSPYDAGLFYCPYVPLQMVRAVGQDTFQPKIGFKTRYGMQANPFSTGAVNDATQPTAGIGSANANRYYRRTLVRNLM